MGIVLYDSRLFYDENDMVRSVTEGVTVTKVSSELTIGLSRDDGPPGDITIGGKLFKAGSFVIVRGATVKLYVNGIYQASDTTNDFGLYQFVVDFDEGDYDIYTSWDGNDTYYEDTSPGVDATYSKIQAAISISVSPSTGAPPLSVSITGFLTVAATASPLGGKTVHLYKDDDEIDSTTTKTYSPQGAYLFTDVVDAAADYYVEFEGDDIYAGCEEDEAILPCTICGSPVPLAALGSEVVCQFCHSVFETVIM